ncbi:hypothetical protein L7F22_020838 [Adiantum nelumboides]|nr:hypothetical protein [Adiantum nelumboides]
MKSEGEKEEANKKETVSEGPAGLAEDASIRPLHDCACYFISLAHAWLERITHLPFPIGTIIGWTEVMVDRWTHPLTQALQCHSLSLLASIDDQMFCLIEGCGFCSKVQLKSGLSHLYTQGVIDTSAGLWVKYELALKEDIRKAVAVGNKVPLLNLVTPILLSLIAPSARAVSDWLSKQDGRKANESTRIVDSSVALMLKQDVAFETHNTVVGKNVQLAGPMIKSGVVNEQYDGQSVSNVQLREGFSDDRCVRMDDGRRDFVPSAKEDTNVGSEERCVRVDDVKKDTNLDALVKDDVVHARKVKIEDQALSKQIDVSMDGIVEDDVLYSEKVASIDDLNAGKAVCASEKIVVSHVAQEGENCLPDVLEMLESSWLLGTSAFRKNAPTLSRK